MNPITAGFVALLVAAPASVSRADGGPDVNVEVGQGYANNLNTATSSSARAGSAFTLLAAYAGFAKRLGKPADIYVDVDGAITRYANYSDLSSSLVGMRMGALVSVGEAGLAHVSLLAIRKWYKDTSRNALSLAGSAAYRQRFTRYLSSRIQYRIRRHSADTEVFSFREHKVSTSAMIGRPILECALGYSYDISDATFYMDRESPTSEGMESSSSDTFTPNQIVYRDDITAHSGHARLWYRPTTWLRLRVSYSLARIDTSEGIAYSQEVLGLLRVF